LQPELDKITKVHALEVPLFSTTVGLAGRVDCVAEHDGKLCVIDFKGSNRQKRSEDIENYFLQATAYSLMWQEMTSRPADAFKILISSEDGSVQVFEGKPIKYVKRLREVINRYYEYMGETKELINTAS
jgi:genome maintenance exonuclease 1